MATLRVLMVCMGNICRSPTAEGVLRHKLQAAGLADHVWTVEGVCELLDPARLLQ